MNPDGSSGSKSQSRIKLKPLKRSTGGQEDSIPSPEPAMTDSQHRLKLTVHKETAPPHTPSIQELTLAQTEIGMPAFREDIPEESDTGSLSNGFDEDFPEDFEKNPGDSGEYLVADEDQSPDATVHSPTDIVEMECIECGETAMFESGTETAKCRKCGGIMYPVGLFDGEDTISYFSSPSADELKAEETDRKSAIKVAQPVSVGMFSSTASGTLNPVASSQNMKPLDFFTQTGSTNSVPLSLQDSNPSGSVVTAELLDEMSRERKNLSEEKNRLKQERADFERAVTEFEGKARKLEQLRLELELKDASARLPLQEPLEQIQEFEEEYEELEEPEDHRRKWNISIPIIICLIIIIAVQSAALIFMLFFGKR